MFFSHCLLKRGCKQNTIYNKMCKLVDWKPWICTHELLEQHCRGYTNFSIFLHAMPIKPTTDWSHFFYILEPESQGSKVYWRLDPVSVSFGLVPKQEGSFFWLNWTQGIKLLSMVFDIKPKSYLDTILVFVFLEGSTILIVSAATSKQAWYCKAEWVWNSSYLILVFPPVF